MQAKTNPVGIHSWVWTGQWTRNAAQTAIQQTREAGYDFLELSGIDPMSVDVKLTRELLADYGLGINVSLALTRDTDITSDDPKTVAAGQRLLQRAVDVVAELDGAYLCGVIYGALRRYDSPASAADRARSIRTLQDVADYATASGVTLGLEVVNRYETNLLNTASQALSYLDDLQRANVVVHLDTYHMHIEEGDMTSPVLACGERLGYVHVGENNRGPLGSGLVGFEEFFAALAAVGYSGPIAFESFSTAVVGPGLSSALCVWREMWRQPGEELAADARAFLEAAGYQLDTHYAGG